MNMSTITFEVPRLSTFVFNKSSEKKIFTIIFVVKSLKGFGFEYCWLSAADGSPTLFHNWANASCYPGNVTRVTGRANTGQSPNFVSMLVQLRIRLTTIEPAMDCDAGLTLKRYRVDRPTLCCMDVGQYRRRWWKEYRPTR